MVKTEKKYYGVIPPIITPVDDRERVDEEGFRALIDHCIAGGLHAIFVAGTNGETMALTQAERDRAIRIAADQCAGRVPVMCGVMDTSTARVLDNIRRIADLGVDCAVVTSIFYARHTSQSETVRHFEQIVRETDIDLAIYNIPPFTGLKLSPETVLEICKMDRIKAYKDSSGAFGEFLTVLRRLNDSRISVLQGLNPLFIPALLMGADGIVPSAAPLFPDIYVDAWEAGRSGDIALARRYGRILEEIGIMLGMSKSSTAANKFAISSLGYTSKRVIAPQDPISPEEEARILRQIDVIRQMYAELKASV